MNKELSIKGFSLVLLLLALILLIVLAPRQDNVCVEDPYDLVKKVEALCYDAHNPQNNNTYIESWGSTYRNCLRYNLNLENETKK